MKKEKIKEQFSRISKKMSNDIKEIADVRHLDIDKNLPRPMGSVRITETITRQPEWHIIKERVKRLPKPEDLER